MTFPKRSDVANHLRRKNRPLSKPRAEIVAVDHVAHLHLQVAPVEETHPIDSSAFLTESAPPKPDPVPDDLRMATHSLQDANKVVGQ